MKARDVIAETFCMADDFDNARVAERVLLAQTPEGEGVYIAPDGTLGRVERTWWCNYGDDRHFRLVPIEEAING